MRLSDSDWATIQHWFDDLVELEPERREEALERASLAPALVEELRTLLEAHERIGILDRITGQVAEPAPASLAPGTMVGPFAVIAPLGRGGMGEVYLAAREGGDFAQQVALKLLRIDHPDKASVIARERRLLSRLEHPGIARLIDGGVTTDGRPFMAMEYVEGETLAQWLTRLAPDLDARLALFLEVCDTLAFAHARLIIHRDLKPANVMVDPRGRGRVLDFGIARLVDEVAPEQTLTLAMLTPEYAAPEQFRREEATTATDIYALGALLFFMLTGRGPWQSEQDSAGLPVSLRRMLDAEVPLPSRSTLPGCGVAASILRGDLDAIVLKAMRRDPTDRYGSVGDLAADVKAHLADLPVTARAGSRAYLVRRFARRHWVTLAASAAVIAALIGGGGAALWQASRAQAERDIALAQTRKAEAVNNAVLLMFRNAQEYGAGAETSAGALIADNAARVLEQFDPKDEGAPPLVLALANLYLQLDDPLSAQRLLEQAIARGIGRGDAEITAQYRLGLGQTYAATGDLARAREELDRADRFWDSAPQRFGRERLESIAARAAIARMEGNREQGIAMLMQSLGEAERFYADEPRELLIRYANLSVHLMEANRLEELGRILDKAEALASRTGLSGTGAAISLSLSRGGWHSRRGDLARAESAFRNAVNAARTANPQSALLGVALNSLGRAQLQQGKGARPERVSPKRSHCSGNSSAQPPPPP